MNMNPATKKSNLFKRKRSKKVRIPVELHPTYNFIGLIIGPRGKTQKDLEAKTGCKIAIRGKGSVKEGARGRRDGKMMEGDNEPLHVVITGDDQKSVDAATDMIEQMLVVIDDEKNVHKQQQLRELALLNGTLKQDEFCSICAEKGHSSFECPKRFSMKKQTVAVKCAICGDTSHPTRDCTQKGAAEKANPQELDSDYMSFMAELDGKKVEKAAPAANASAPAKSDANTHTPSGLPPPPSGRTTAPPSGGPPAPPTSLPPPPPAAGLPPPPPSVGSLPPPPAQKPPFVAAAPYGQQPPPAANYYGHQQQQAPPGQPQYYGGQQQQQYPPPQGGQPAYQQQPPYGQPPQQQQQQQAHQPRPGEETAAWDPSSYYGYGGQGDAGGFQWWS